MYGSREYWNTHIHTHTHTYIHTHIYGRNMQMLENLLKEMKEVHTSKLTSAALLFLHNTNAPNQIKLLTVFWEKQKVK